ncbi:polysaccharide pyruvyl transferase family protein [Cutibacterium equinum]|uniref:Polysaccharide pyruvyl transferase family protein n=1 Tax=Cutibacterium equinum TaxID=3016342 RepID=A0ABY7QWN6_9ACTN|nr:polysaccharide pyruvyl transferase family protein [Cutibacterium equinum]WCC79140.1 polysaccharide pyruvyl transferase family protein [Cutibacterium equinum]
MHEQLDASYRQAIGDARDVILLDQPRHRNLGDTLIFAGELATLTRLEVRVRYCATAFSARWDEIRKLPRDWPILCHGGGNFGDAYSLHQGFREALVEEFPRRKIVFLPNTFWFRDNSNIEHTRKALRVAHDLTLMVRARRSEAFAHQHFGQHKVLYCPDSALGIEANTAPYYLRHRAKYPSQVHILSRDDEESRREQVRMRPTDTVGDYRFTIPGRARWILSRLTTDRPLDLLPLGPVRDLMRESQSKLLASANLRAFLTTFQGAGIVATNRLHAHVYCALAGIPHVVTDNSYGKISEIYQEWTGHFSTAHWADNLQDAYEQAVALAEQQKSERDSGQPCPAGLIRY